MAVVTAIAVGVAAVSAAASIHQAKKAESAGKKKNRIARKTNQLKNKQAKRAFLRNFRQAQANVLVGNVMAGVGLGSSAFQGTSASEKSQANTAINEFKEFDALGAQFTQQQNKQASAQGSSATFSAISSFAMSFAGSGIGS